MAVKTKTKSVETPTVKKIKVSCMLDSRDHTRLVTASAIRGQNIMEIVREAVLENIKNVVLP